MVPTYLLQYACYAKSSALLFWKWQQEKQVTKCSAPRLIFAMNRSDLRSYGSEAELGAMESYIFLEIKWRPMICNYLSSLYYEDMFYGVTKLKKWKTDPSFAVALKSRVCLMNDDFGFLEPKTLLLLLLVQVVFLSIWLKHIVFCQLKHNHHH